MVLYPNGYKSSVDHKYIPKNPNKNNQFVNVKPKMENLLPIHQKIHEKLEHFFQTNKIPNIIFHGLSGSGKRTIVDQFIYRIYDNDSKKIKTNVMFVNCAHGKGIKFIREELKFFAKTNIQCNSGVAFKTIVLLNADFLTIDAQSALRRCIELFSYNTRFFIIVENKNRLLNPILSRFCEIYVEEYMVEGKVVNLHQHKIRSVFPSSKLEMENLEWSSQKMDGFMGKLETITHLEMMDLAAEFYERGLSCLDMMRWVEDTELLDLAEKGEIYMCFHRIKSEYRCEKLLMFYMLDFFITPIPQKNAQKIL
jgi:hypothetical protein